MFTAETDPTFFPEDVFEFFHADHEAAVAEERAEAERIAEENIRRHREAKVAQLAAYCECIRAFAEHRREDEDELTQEEAERIADAEGPDHDPRCEPRPTLMEQILRREQEQQAAPALTVISNPKVDEYDPSSWLTRRLSETRVEMVNKSTGARLEFVVAWGRVFGCQSDASGAYYDLPAGACSCGDALHRAPREGRDCRHGAAYDRLLIHLESEKVERLAA